MTSLKKSKFYSFNWKKSTFQFMPLDDMRILKKPISFNKNFQIALVKKLF